MRVLRRIRRKPRDLAEVLAKNLRVATLAQVEWLVSGEGDEIPSMDLLRDMMAQGDET